MFTLRVVRLLDYCAFQAMQARQVGTKYAKVFVFHIWYRSRDCWQSASRTMGMPPQVPSSSAPASQRLSPFGGRLEQIGTPEVLDEVVNCRGRLN